MKRNITITIFEDGCSIGGTVSTKDLDEDLKECNVFGKEYNECSDEEKTKWIIDELKEQINDELERIFNQ